MSPFPSQTPDSHRPLIGTALELQTGVRTERIRWGRWDLQAQSALPRNANCGGTCTLNSSQLLHVGKLKI